MAKNIFRIFDGRTHFWQWDTGQKLIVLDESITQVQLSNRDMNHSITKDVYEHEGKRICDIPDIVLQSPGNIIAYAYIYDGEFGHTVESVKFAVAKRPSPDSENGYDDEDIIRICDGGNAAGY